MENQSKKCLVLALLLAIVVMATSCGKVIVPDKNITEDTTLEVSKETNNDNNVTENDSTQKPLELEPIELSEEEEELKVLLTELKKNDFAIDDSTDVDYIIDKMIEHIGSVDSKLRDDLILQTFVHWMFKLEPEKIKEIWAELLSENKLGYMVGENNTDSVFTRSFSVLTLDIIMTYNLNGEYLTEDEVNNTLNKIVDYLKKEKDCRGKVVGKGWAHAIAHSGDLLSTLAKYEQFGEEELLEILFVIRDKILINSYEYKDREEARLMQAVKIIINKKKISDDSLVKWVESIANNQEVVNGKDSIIYSNAKDFLIELYSVVKYMDDENAITPIVEKFINSN